MEVIGALKLLIDVGFVFTVVFLCLRSTKTAKPSTSSVNVKEIEESIRSVVTDAEDAGRELTRELNKRQRGLERILFDLDSSESRLLKSARETEQLADAKIAELKSLISSAAALPLSRGEDKGEKVASAPIIKEPAQPLSVEGSVEEDEHQVLHRERSTNVTIELSTSEIDVEDAVSQPKQRAANLNIFGEPISLDSTEDRPPLNSQIEIERDDVIGHNAPPSVRYDISEGREKVQEIYNRAKDLLTAGKSVMAVAAATNLPPAAVERINATIYRPSPIINRPPPSRDSRLGVLAGMRRNSERV